MTGEVLVRLEDVSKFYGDVLGVNRITLSIGSGITSLVGPNGAGKTTLLNLLAGLIRPTRGRLSVLGCAPEEPNRYLVGIGYCAQYDSFPPGLTVGGFMRTQLALRGMPSAEAESRAARALARTGMSEAAGRALAACSKGMRQRVRLALALAHEPRVLLLDEPLNGFDPLARAEAAVLFRALADEGRCLIVSSHILHEVDRLSDRVILMQNGYVVGDGSVAGVREELREHPLQVLVLCDRPEWLAARLFAEQQVSEVRLTESHDGAQGLLARTREPSAFFLLLNQLAAAGELVIETVAPVDENLDAVYRLVIQKGTA